MPNRLASDFEARRPLLQHVADSLRDELTEAISDAGIDCSVAFHVATAAEFADRVQYAGQSCNNPLLEIPDQIRGRVDVGALEHVTSVELALADHVSVVSKAWSNDVDGELPTLRLQCLIPPQAKPDGWPSRTDVPSLFELTIGIQVQKPQPSDPIPVLLELPSTDNGRPLALVMKGGGIKGLAYVGATEELSPKYPFNWFVGTSAGAVAAVLLGAGYTVAELQEILKNKNFRDFFDGSRFGKWVNLFVHHGLHRADTFTSWLDTLLAEKLGSHRRVRLSDLPHRVTVYASQRGHSAVKFDSRDNDADAAYAVRCSMSIPLVFIPESNQGIRAYDGGLQHNYPIEELLRSHPHIDFISLYLGPELYQPLRQRFVLSDLISIWTEASDPEAISKYRNRTVVIDPHPIGTLDFDLTDDEKDFLLACGRTAALAHLDKTSEAYTKAKFRRDELKQAVVATRRIKRQRRRRNRLIGFGITLLLLVFAVWWLYF